MRALALLLIVLLGACGQEESTPEPPRVATHVGSEACAECHAEVVSAWRGSHHGRAMQVATPDTVLGDFSGVSVEHFGRSTTFARSGEHFVVNTEGSDGAPRDFRVAYTFGVEPLQQYLVRFPDGRVQALPFAWDSRPAEAGGQRWYHLYPDEAIPHTDLLHWTGIQQNWNHMCASCHSTGVEKGYDEETGRFETTWSEIDVSCEACHGPASAHVDDPQRKRTSVAFATGAEWEFVGDVGIARRVPALDVHTQVDTCGRCHARASLLSEDAPAGQPLLDTHRVELLDTDLYFPDGQIRGEVYEYGSFLQSRMYRAGVQCSDCHDPHGLEPVGDESCAGCHRAEVYAAPGHHHHAEAVSCVDCHMPARTYMGVDVRHDHGFRVPRPDLDDAPNTCEACHAERGNAWAAARVLEWRQGKPPPPRRTSGLHSGSAERLTELAGDRDRAGIVRATALRQLGPLLGPESSPVVEEALRDADPLVRMAASGAVRNVPPRERLELLRPRLADPVLAVRLEAANALRGVPPEVLRPVDGAILRRVEAEYVRVQRLHADRPESWLNLGILEASGGDAEGALEAYRRALRIEPRFVPAAVNLADLYRELDRDSDGEAVLRAAVASAPDSAAAHHALGLTLVRLGRRGEAGEELRRAFELDPDDPRYAFVYAVSLESAGDVDAARRVVRALLERHPGYPPALELHEKLAAP